MVLYSRYQSRLVAVGTVLANGIRVFSGGRNTRAESFYWSRLEDNLENKNEDGSENGIGRYEERVCPQTVKSRADHRFVSGYVYLS